MNIIINGGTKGIGRETAMLMAEDKNNRILVTGRDMSAFQSLSENYPDILTFQVDLSELDNQLDKFSDYVSNHLKTVDILINMAGTLIVRNFMDSSNDEARKMMETNFIGPAAIIRNIVPLMPKGSHIVNIASMGGFQGSVKYKGLAYYSSSKAALACLTECLAAELTDNGIAVNCLALGAVQTEMFKEAFPGFTAPLEAKKMAEYISDFALNGNKYYNGKILPVALNNP